MAERGDHVTCCIVCSEKYRETGEHAPRIFPCSHSACEGCITQKLLQRFSLDCPQCGASHFATDGLDSFPTNMYILAYIHKTVSRSENKALCTTHSREQNLFCEGCRASICLMCLKNDHKGHDFRDLEEVKHNGEIIMSVRKNIQRSKEQLESLQQKQKEVYQGCMQQIQSKTAELVEMIKEKSAQFVEGLKDEAFKFDAEVNHMLNEMNGDLDKLSPVDNGDLLICGRVSQEETLKRNVAQSDPGKNIDSSRPVKEEDENDIDGAEKVNNLPTSSRDLMDSSVQSTNASTGFSSSTTKVKLESTQTEGSVSNAESLQREPGIGKRPETVGTVDAPEGPPMKKRYLEGTKNPEVSSVNAGN